MSRIHRQRLRVLTYHRVARPEDHPGLNPRLISARPDEFARQMAHLARRYAVVSLPEVLDALDGGRALPARAVLVTFDDAYRDFADHAWPVLEGLRLPATVFVPTAFPDRPERAFWADRLYRSFERAGSEEPAGTPIGKLPLRTAEERRAGLKRLQDHLKTLAHAEAAAFVDRVCDRLGPDPEPVPSVLSWDRLRELAGRGISLGAHSRSHPILTRISREEVRGEVARAQEDLRREIGSALPVFCYPNGSHDDGVVEVLREEGIRLAFTTRDGQDDLSACDPLRLRRTNVTPRSRGRVFRARLWPWVSRLDAWRHR